VQPKIINVNASNRAGSRFEIFFGMAGILIVTFPEQASYSEFDS
jgi:hypothetical protein